MGQLNGYLASSPAGSDAGNMSPSQTMLVAAVRLGISDARGINRISEARRCSSSCSSSLGVSIQSISPRQGPEPTSSSKWVREPVHSTHSLSGSWASLTVPTAASHLSDTCTSHGVEGKDEVVLKNPYSSFFLSPFIFLYIF